MKRFLITGVKGQIGTKLLPRLLSQFGKDNVIATDVGDFLDMGDLDSSVNYFKLDVTDRDRLEYIISNEKITNVVHLAGILSALSERKPELAKEVNIDSVHYLFRASLKYNLSLFIPSTIGVFGPDTPKRNVPLLGIRNPIGLYGVSKLYMENMGNYYKKFYNMDFRSIRYIGVISPMEYAYNGSTDYATEIFFKARKKEHYNICLKSSTRLPMAYIDDVIDGTMQLLEAPKDNLTVGTYNMNCVDFSPLELYTEVKKYYPELTVDYKPDIRDTMANSWPHHYDDTSSRNDWGWNPKYDTLEKLVKIMYDNTSFKTNETKI